MADHRREGVKLKTDNRNLKEYAYYAKKGCEVKTLKDYMEG